MTTIPETAPPPPPPDGSNPTLRVASAVRCPRGDVYCPHPEDDSVDEIEFTPIRKMVDWLGPTQLADTGLKAVIASTFGSYADKRELQAALAPISGPDQDYSKEDELWFDYIADLGDGFNPTYAMARLLGQEYLTIKRDDGTRIELPRGRFLVLGGDQVYPTAARDEYLNRFVGPYRSAFPWSPNPPDLFALPGNHDWYDGLTSFLRIFCQRGNAPGGRWIGGWQTRQRRSYFALALPHNWWVWAIDSQLEADMDAPQLRFFDELGDAIRKSAAEGGPPPRVVLVTAEPNWVYCGDGDARSGGSAVDHDAFNTLAHFEKRYLRQKNIRVAAVISGDLHHYVRYELDTGAPKEERTQRITSGGGGAFLLGTHHMPKRIAVREGTSERTIAEEPRNPYKQQGAFPRTADSRRLALGVVGLPFRNWTFGLFLGFAYLFFDWILQAFSRFNPKFEGGSLINRLIVSHGGLGEQLAYYGDALAYSPFTIILALLIVFGLFKFTDAEHKRYGRILTALGLVHGVAHIVLACLLLWGVSEALAPFGIVPGEGPFAIWFAPAILLAGWAAGSILFGVYLWLVSTFVGAHTGELFSSQHIEGYKNCIRMHVTRGGELEIYPIGLRDVPNDWKFVPPGQTPGSCGKPWFESAGKKPLNAQLIDEVIRLQ